MNSYWQMKDVDEGKVGKSLGCSYPVAVDHHHHHHNHHHFLLPLCRVFTIIYV
jgi:hypothetical protein